jgi:catechol 2,3-dioxygenase-like lactoylglutathione lyase family enzyme
MRNDVKKEIPATAVQGVGPLGLSVSDIDRSVTFYEALGFVASERTTVGASGANALGAEGPDAMVVHQMVERNGFGILLLQVKPKPKGSPGAGAAAQFGLAYLELYVSDMDRVAAEIKRCGGSVLEQSRKRLSDVEATPVDLMFCKDPDGTLIALVHVHT